VQTDQLTDWASFFNRLPNVADDIEGAAAICHNINQNLAKSLGGRLAFVDEAHPGIRVTDDGRERLIQFMGEGGSHFAKQTDPAEKIDLVALAPGFFLGELAGRNVH